MLGIPSAAELSASILDSTAMDDYSQARTYLACFGWFHKKVPSVEYSRVLYKLLGLIGLSPCVMIQPVNRISSEQTAQASLFNVDVALLVLRSVAVGVIKRKRTV